MAGSAIRSLWDQSHSSSHEPVLAVVQKDKLATVWYNGNITTTLSRRRYGRTEFFKWCKDGEVFWFAQVDAEGSVKVNNHLFEFNVRNCYTLGPLPLFSIWETEKGPAFVYAGKSAIEYVAVSDHEHGGGRASKRQKRCGLFYLVWRFICNEIIGGWTEHIDGMGDALPALQQGTTMQTWFYPKMSAMVRGLELFL